jgi:hypothetical protein
MCSDGSGDALAELEHALDRVAEQNLKGLFGPQVVDWTKRLLRAANRLDAQVARSVREGELTQADEQRSGAASSGSASTCPNPGGEDRGDLMDQCSSARHPTGHPLLLTNRRGHGLSVGLDERTRDTQCSPAGGSDTRSCCRTNRMQPH